MLKNIKIMQKKSKSFANKLLKANDFRAVRVKGLNAFSTEVGLSSWSAYKKAKQNSNHLKFNTFIDIQCPIKRSQDATVLI